MKITFARTALRALLLLLTASTAASAQDSNWAEKMFDRLKVDFGVIARGSDARQVLEITNPYQQTVNISDVRTTCGCSAAKPSQNHLSSGETVYIEVTMDTQRFTRRKDSNVVVTFDQPSYAEVRVPITAYIRTDVVINPGAAKFGAIDVGESAQKTLNIAYAGRDDWTIKEVRTQSDSFSAEVVETGRGGGRVSYDLQVTLSPELPVGMFRDQLVLVTDDANSPTVPVLVEARIEADITVTPDVVSLGLLTPGRDKTVNVVLRGKKPFEIAKIECESDRRCFKVRLPKAERQVHVLPLTVTPPDETGTLTEEFTITIANRPEPITFKAYGRVAE